MEGVTILEVDGDCGTSGQREGKKGLQSGHPTIRLTIEDKTNLVQRQQTADLARFHLQNATAQPPTQ